MDKATFNAIRRALHPDSRQSISDKKLGEAFDTFMALEKYVLNEKDSPDHAYPDGSETPRNLAEWDKRRAAAKKAKRTSGQFGSSPTLRVAGRRERPRIGQDTRASHVRVWVTQEVDLLGRTHLNMSLLGARFQAVTPSTATIVRCVAACCPACCLPGQHVTLDLKFA